jgi:hypothetical protein
LHWLFAPEGKMIYTFLMAGNIFLSPGTKIPAKAAAEAIAAPAASMWGLTYGEWGMLIIVGILSFFVIKWVIRFVFELWLSRNLVYIQVALPRSDSKLDKEHETKKDFKEKIGIMNLVHNSFWKLSSTSLKYTVLHAIFHHIKISYEIVYKEGQVYFFLVTYKSLFPTISQTITSIYPDAEVVIRDKKDYVAFTDNHSVVRSTSIRKTDDPYFPIKTYKYFEEDPLGSITNVFGGLKKTDVAVYQVIAKPLSHSYNDKAKEIAGLYSKGKYKQVRKFPIFADISQ